MDYTELLLQLTGFLAVVWLSDLLFFRRRRKRRAETAGIEPRESWPVEWARSLLPILLLVLVVRSAVAEPYRIPSGSMMPTLEVGDFIMVSKFSYGIRLPGTDTKIVNLGEPKRGDVVVFRPPWAPGESWIKRVVGLPGDEVVIRNKSVWINGEPVSTELIGPYRGDSAKDEDAKLMRYGASLLTERLGNVAHQIIEMSIDDGAPDVPNDQNPRTVPSGCYFVMGDNRGDSEDSRYHGCVPEENLVGKAEFIWMSLAALDRIATPIR
jgi:signal peptidase I